MLSRRLLKQNTLLQWPAICRRVSQRVPFDLDEEDDKYKSFNNMYVEMFTPMDDVVVPQTNEHCDKSTNQIDEINQEMNELYNIGFEKLSSLELDEVVKNKGRFILQSMSTNPYYNLALEDYVFRHTPLENDFCSHRLLFYKNYNCVVIGKNQTVWKELFLNNLAPRGYEFLRRLSGGGAVVHDLGNVNYSYITSRKEFDRHFFSKLIIKWLRNRYPHIVLNVGPRGDILLDGKKVSGSAFKIAKGKAYHHGTMLINSNLENFKGLLKPDTVNGVSWSCNSVDSVRSQVTNIPLDGTECFIDTCVRGFQERFNSANVYTDKVPVYYCDEICTINEDITHTMSKLQSDKWKFFSGPDFTLQIADGNHELSVKKGIIVSSSIPETVGLSFKEFTEGFEGNSFSAP
ncbi:related to Putative lipoate-protein ligase A [Zygosaccharomyces bailii]|nr:related to Putative lipoate-protein ligase A [Zygosaccharomyces bailii]